MTYIGIFIIGVAAVLAGLVIFVTVLLAVDKIKDIYAQKKDAWKAKIIGRTRNTKL